MITAKQAETLGYLAQTVAFMFRSRSSDVGDGVRMTLRLPADKSDGAPFELFVAGIEAAVPAPVGEVLRVDDNLVEDVATRDAFRAFLRAAFDPPVVSGGEFRVVFRDGADGGVIFCRRDDGPR